MFQAVDIREVNVQQIYGKLTAKEYKLYIASHSTKNSPILDDLLT